MRILMVASEVAPHAKTGGLADVLGSLPRVLRKLGHDVRVVLPLYQSVQIPRGATPKTISVSFDGGDRNAKVWCDEAPISSSQTSEFSPRNSQNTPNDASNREKVASEPSASTRELVPIYFLDAPEFFARPQLYNFDDDILRFGFFCRAALELPRAINWIPDIIHGHDWHAGLLPLYLKQLREQGELGELASTRSVFSIHNLAYQGLAHRDFLPRLGLDWRWFNLHELEFYGQINPLKAGLVFSDEVTTVSPRYAREIQTPDFGEGLEGVLAARSGEVRGILNGIDEDKWNPKTDAYLAANYEARDLSGKRECKRELVRICGFDDSEDAPIIGMVSRLSSQKGFDLVARALRPMLEMGFCFVLLGSGDERYTRIFRALHKKHAPRASMQLGKFDDELAHRIYAGADFFLMPSLYEPCGLGQMIALRYGTIPIVRKTGGLADTVREYSQSEESGNGFLFENFQATAMLDALARGLEIYRGPHWNALQKRAMAEDFSWRASAAQYEAMYENVLSR